MTLDLLSQQIENALVERNLRHMAVLHGALPTGYCLRAAKLLLPASRVLIATGFPVEKTFETDGPLGAIALYQALTARGVHCDLACADPLASQLCDDFNVHTLKAFDPEQGISEAREALAALQPDAIVSIERPGMAADKRYYNMRSEDISARCAVFDYYLELADCPTIAVGDGGNEIGMGKLKDQVKELAIEASVTSCDELIVADVSNWGAYALIALIDALSGDSRLAAVEHEPTLRYLSNRGSVDGVTRENTLSEDGLPVEAGEALLHTLQELVTQYRARTEITQ